jgi:hypothetical protein
MYSANLRASGPSIAISGLTTKYLTEPSAMSDASAIIATQPAILKIRVMPLLRRATKRRSAGVPTSGAALAERADVFDIRLADGARNRPFVTF